MNLSDKELFEQYAASEYQSERYEELHDEINKRIRDELQKQMTNAGLDDPETTAILRGFDDAATWHWDAARHRDFERSVTDAVAEYLANERSVYAEFGVKDEGIA